uniref:Photosystem II reaction center protein Z n=14 Tax=BOP clade TaxID=359160 RepID=A0A2Z1UAW8_9POAL|nr:photosystem II protein Z [Cephalostachyum chinense]
MTIAFQLAVFALIATSSVLVISVPLVFASPDGWSNNKNVVFSGTSLDWTSLSGSYSEFSHFLNLFSIWIGLVFLVAILNSLIS